MKSNKLRERRLHLGFTQSIVANATGLTRQSIHAMESNTRSPSVEIALKLAAVLRTTVERLFGSPPETKIVSASASSSGGARSAKRVRLARIDGAWHRYPLTQDSTATSAADGILRGPAGDEVELLRPEHELDENLVLLGCAPALAILAEHASRGERGARIIWVKASSTAALQALAQGGAHVAGAHLVDAKQHSYNIADVKRLTRGLPTTLITLGWWDVGFVLPRGNPRRIRKPDHLLQKGLRMAIREEGSGARRLFDAQLKKAGIAVGAASQVQVDGHLDVARAVATGLADVGIATADAALSFNLAFVPLDHERYDLAIPNQYLTDARIIRMLDTLATSAFRRDIASLGYETTTTGTRAA